MQLIPSRIGGELNFKIMDCKRVMSLDCHSQGAVSWSRNEFIHDPRS